ncbi:MAG: HEAT repeat domain-containing protein [Asgard group archaeon]|nr:HEAT repeat domain-containing protein [Asgard group archaeon]
MVKENSEVDLKEKVLALIKLLKSTDLETRQQAAWQLKVLAEKKRTEVELAVPDIINALHDEDWAVRKMSILALGELNVQKEIPTIIELLRNDVDTEVRAGAAEALGKMKAEQAVPYLIKALDESADIVQQVSVWSLGLIGKKANEAVSKLLEILSKPEDVGIVQISTLAAWALGEIGDKIAIKPLIIALNNAAYHEKKFTIAYSLALLEDGIGEGYSELLRMKENYELDESELKLFEKLNKK